MESIHEPVMAELNILSKKDMYVCGGGGMLGFFDD